MAEHRTRLNRALNLPLLVLYGLGTIVGAGIYALTGEIAQVAGYGAPLSFLAAAIVAGFTACSFAELAGRYPRAAGAALYLRKGFGNRRLALVAGLMVAASGVVSSAALANGFFGYLQEFVAWDRTLAIVGALLALGTLAAWGITQSVAVAALITVVEVGGLLTVVVLGAGAFTELPGRWNDIWPGTDAEAWSGVVVGVTLSFYAFIGFEDMVDVAEEVKDVRRTLPAAILLTLGLATVLYVLLMTSALLTLPPADLAASTAPIATLFEAHTGADPTVMGVIAMFAIINGAMIQIVMASRVLYGLASRGQLPAVFAHVNARTQTPLLATGVVTLLAVVLALLGRLAGLATATSVIVLSIFAGVNLALWRIKGRDGPCPETVNVPRWVPLTGALLSGAFMLREVLLI